MICGYGSSQSGRDLSMTKRDLAFMCHFLVIRTWSGPHDSEVVRATQSGRRARLSFRLFAIVARALSNCSRAAFGYIGPKYTHLCRNLRELH